MLRTDYPEIKERKHLVHRKATGLLLISWLLVLTTCQHTKPGAFSIEETDTYLLLKEHHAPVLCYRIRSDAASQTATRNNYIHPLFSISGDTLTENFPADHLHHRGIFWAWHQVWIGDRRLGDGWTYEDFKWEIIEIITDTDNSEAMIGANIVWKSPLWTDPGGRLLLLANEQVRITVFPAENAARMLWFDLKITSLNDSLQIGGAANAKGYGGFSWRVRLPEQVIFTGRDGIVTPEKNAVQAGPWIHMYGYHPDPAEQGGILVISHPDNLGNAGRWILREKQNMQNAVFPGRIPVVLNEGDYIRLKYCMVIYEGAAEDFDPAHYYRKYLRAL